MYFYLLHKIEIFAAGFVAISYLFSGFFLQKKQAQHANG